MRFAIAQSYCQDSEGVWCFLMIASDKVIQNIMCFLFENRDLRIVNDIEELKHFCLCSFVYKDICLQLSADHIACYGFD